MKRAAGIVGLLLASCGKTDQAPRPLLSEEERARHNAPLEGEPCAFAESSLLSGSVALGGENHPVTLRTHVDDCGNLVAAWYDPFLGGAQLVRVLSNGELDWKASFPNDGQGTDSGLGVNDIASDHAGSLFVATQHTLLGVTAAGARYPISAEYPIDGWSFIERIEDVRGDDEPSSGVFVAGPSSYTELALPSGYVLWQGSGAPIYDPGRLQTVPLSSGSSFYFPKAEFLNAQLVASPREGLEVEPAGLVVERVQVSFDGDQSPGRTVVFEEALEDTPHSFSLAARGGEYAFAVTPQSDEVAGDGCASEIHWLSRGASFELESCPGVLDSLFTADGSYWSLWTDREAVQSLVLFRWEPGASAPREVALEVTEIWTNPETGNIPAASLAKTPHGTVVVTAVSSDREELRFVEVGGAD